MPKHPAAMTLATVGLDRSSSVPMHRQLYNWLREAILAGRLVGGTRLPATRTLAGELDVSRNTVVNAFDQLLAEGYIEGRVGAGTYVSCVLPDEMLSLEAAPASEPPQEVAGRRLSGRARALSAMPAMPTMPLAAAPRTGVPRQFRPGLPALDAFPFDLWARLAWRRLRNPPAELLGYGDPAGYRPLREAIAAYLGAARAVRCTADQVIVVAGSQQALDLASRVLLDPGDEAWIEEPGYMGARGAILGAGARLVPVPVDDEGLDVSAGIERGPGARLIYASPSCQYPLGATMSLARRLALLEWAGSSGAWVLEDDYNSEYRYAGRPLAALQGLDTDGRVIYLGSFSKVLFPSLRLGYLVVPPDLVEAFVRIRSRADIHSPTIEQAALADFMAEGHFGRHIRRMRALYARRQAVLVEAAGRELAGMLEVRPAEAGMHLVGWLPEGIDDAALALRALGRDVYTPPLSAYYIESRSRGGLLLGYTGVPEEEIEEGVGKLAQVLRESLS